MPPTREQQVLAMIAEALNKNANRLNGYQIVLFGSRARGNPKRHSDYDLAVVGPRPLPLKDFYAIENMLDELPTLYRIDWVDLSTVGKRFREQALQHTKVLYG